MIKWNTSGLKGQGKNLALSATFDLRQVLKTYRLSVSSCVKWK